MQITLEVPEQYLLDSSPAELGGRIKLYAALLMFHSGEVSAGAAAEFAGVDRLAFAAECQRRGIPVIDYPAEELRGEIRDLAQPHIADDGLSHAYARMAADEAREAEAETWFDTILPDEAR